MTPIRRIKQNTIDQPWFAPAAVTVVFFVVCYTAALSHVMWRDEWQPLLTARDTSNFGEFFEQSRYLGMDGYFSFCWMIQKTGLGLWFFKLVLVLISAVGIYAFCKFSPFTRLQNVLFAFGYFPLYEYGAILRNYGIILTTSIIATAIISSSALHPLAFGVCIAAMAQTNGFGVIFSMIFAATYLYEFHRRGLDWSALAKPRPIIGAVIALVGIAFGVLSVLKTFFLCPPWVAAAQSGGFVASDPYFYRFVQSLPVFFRGIFPVPLFGSWNSQILDPWPWVQGAMSVSLIVLLCFMLRRSKTALVFFAFCLIALGGMFLFAVYGQMRHHGHYFVLVVLALWLALRLGPANSGKGITLASWSGSLPSMVFTGILFVHLAAGAIFVLQEQLVPFSGSKEAARIIKSNAPEDALVIGDIDAWMGPLSGYLGRPIYVASRRELGSYVVVDQKRRWNPLSPEELSAVVSECLQRERRDVILVTNYPISMPANMGVSLGAATASSCGEQYFIFRIPYAAM